MEIIKQMIGFWIICLAISSVIVSCFCDVSRKEKIYMVIGAQTFIALLEVGLYLIGAE